MSETGEATTAPCAQGVQDTTLREDPETILVTSSSPHIHCGSSVQKIMRDVIFSLIPCVVAAIYFFGLSAAWLIAVCIATSMATEYACRKLMRRENSLSDLSAVVTGLLLALTLPPQLPLWQAALGSVVAIAIAKQLYGGLGYNPFNPALVGRAFLLISFTATMTTWSPSDWHYDYTVGHPGLLESVVGAQVSAQTTASYAKHADTLETSDQPGDEQTETTDEAAKPSQQPTKQSSKRVIKAQTSGLNVPIDLLTTATPLGEFKKNTRAGKIPFYEMHYSDTLRARLFWGNVNGSIGETSAIAILLGFAYLLIRRVITPHITLSYLITVAVFAWALRFLDPSLDMPVDFHLLAGGVLFGAVFMATDMVTSPTTPWGHRVFGIGCGLLTMIIRVVPKGAYPEGVTFAILIMCAFTPLINRVTRYQRWGIGKRAKLRREV